MRPGPLILGAALWIGAGCTPSGHGATPGTVASGATAPKAIDDSLRRLATNGGVLSVLTEQKAFECVRDRGFKTPAQTATSEDPALSLDLIAWPRPDDLRLWRDEGFGIWRQFGEPAQQTPQSTGGLSAAEYRDFEAAMAELPGSPRYESESGLQVSTTGCVAEARLDVYESFDNFSEIDSFITSIQQEIQTSIFASPGYQALEDDWSQCMSDAGYEIRSQFDVAGLVHQTYYPDNRYSNDGKAQELALAAADATCIDEVSYIERAGEVVSTVESNVLSTKAGEIDGITELVLRLVEVATVT